MPNIRWLLTLITVLHRALYRVTGGRIGKRVGKARMLLLTTLGRRTGQPRVTPLLYVEDGPRFVVIASNAGDDRNPAWLLNLRKQPAARVQVGSQHIAVQAREATDAESERLWPKLLDSYSYYTDYRSRTQRHIPVVLLEPSEDQNLKV
jgi:deazaflavin-dependent oxidoreductase (nitroreductase family)